MKRINRCNEVVKLLSAARCCAKAIVDVAAVEFRFSAVEFVRSDSVNLFVIGTRERKAVKRENEFSEANRRFGARLFVSALVKKIFECQESFVVGDNCI